MMIESVRDNTISLTRLRELLAAAELLADSEIDMVIPGTEYSAYANSIAKDLRDILSWREKDALHSVK